MVHDCERQVAQFDSQSKGAAETELSTAPLLFLSSMETEMQNSCESALTPAHAEFA